MTSRAALLGAIASIALANAANAGHENSGWYVGVEVGTSWIADIDFTARLIPLPCEIGTNALGGGCDGADFPLVDLADIDVGWVVPAALGYAFSDHWRVEGEVAYRSNDQTGAELTELSFMLNALYDVELASSLSLSLGAGAGYDLVTLDLPFAPDEEAGSFAYQGIAGLSYALGKRTDLTLTYRYLVVSEPEFAFAIPGATLALELDDVQKHALTIGLRYAL